ncbi:MAG: hypothetical protein Q9227_001122 [Pyrenula ochraceoflavens]
MRSGIGFFLSSSLLMYSLASSRPINSFESRTQEDVSLPHPWSSAEGRQDYATTEGDLKDFKSKREEPISISPAWFSAEHAEEFAEIYGIEDGDLGDSGHLKRGQTNSYDASGAVVGGSEISIKNKAVGYEACKNCKREAMEVDGSWVPKRSERPSESEMSAPGSRSTGLNRMPDDVTTKARKLDDTGIDRREVDTDVHERNGKIVIAETETSCVGIGVGVACGA